MQSLEVGWLHEGPGSAVGEAGNFQDAQLIQQVGCGLCIPVAI